MTTISDDIISDGTDGRGEASAGSRSSLGRTDTDPADAETVSGSNSGIPPVSPETGGAATGEANTAGDAAETPGEGVGASTDSSEASDELARVTAERDEYLDLARRTQAEFENFRKRTARERAELRARAIADVVRDLLPVVDNIDRALEAAEAATASTSGTESAGGGAGADGTTSADTQPGGTAPTGSQPGGTASADTKADGAQSSDALLQGIKMVHAELHSYLERLGLKAIEADGARFDPALHEAIASVAVEGAEPGVVHEVHQKGFQLDEIVVRPARVVVTA